MCAEAIMFAHGHKMSINDAHHPDDALHAFLLMMVVKADF